jgi:hypothetical protein
MTVFFQIVPIGDGFNYVSVDDFGTHILIRKDESLNTKLIFKTFDNAQAYLNTYLDSTKYEVEELLLNEKYYRLD